MWDFAKFRICVFTGFGRNGQNKSNTKRPFICLPSLKIDLSFFYHQNGMSIHENLQVMFIISIQIDLSFFYHPCKSNYHSFLNSKTACHLFITHANRHVIFLPSLKINVFFFLISKRTCHFLQSLKIDASFFNPPQTTSPLFTSRTNIRVFFAVSMQIDIPEAQLKKNPINSGVGVSNKLSRNKSSRYKNNALK